MLFCCLVVFSNNFNREVNSSLLTEKKAPQWELFSIVQTSPLTIVYTAEKSQTLSKYQINYRPKPCSSGRVLNSTADYIMSCMRVYTLGKKCKSKTIWLWSVWGGRLHSRTKFGSATQSLWNANGVSMEPHLAFTAVQNKKMTDNVFPLSALVSRISN